LTLLSIVLIASATVGALIVTPLGGRLLLHYTRQQFSSIGLINIGSYEGSLEDGFIIKNVVIKGIAYVPNAQARIQEIDVRLPLWDLQHSTFSIFNARLVIPDSDPLVFDGQIEGGRIKGEFFGNSVDLQEADRFGPVPEVKGLRGFLSHIDVAIDGPLATPHVWGQFRVDSVRYRSIFLTDTVASLNLSLVPQSKDWRVKGQININSGSVYVQHTNLKLLPSKFIFTKDFLNPAMNIHLGSEVEDMDIDLIVKGTMSNPQLTVVSDPPMPPQDALQVLFTGDAFSTSTTPFSGINSSQLAGDFLNYSLQDINDENYGLKAKLTNNLKLGVEMDQLPSPPGETNVYYSRKVNGEMDLNSHMSLNVSQEVMPDNRAPYGSASSSQNADAAPETQVYWEYKKRF
jgi:hypothetical protein